MGIERHELICHLAILGEHRFTAPWNNLHVVRRGVRRGPLEEPPSAKLVVQKGDAVRVPAEVGQVGGFPPRIHPTAERCIEAGVRYREGPESAFRGAVKLDEPVEQARVGSAGRDVGRGNENSGNIEGALGGLADGRARQLKEEPLQFFGIGIQDVLALPPDDAGRALHAALPGEERILNHKVVGILRTGKTALQPRIQVQLRVGRMALRVALGAGAPLIGNHLPLGRNRPDPQKQFQDDAAPGVVVSHGAALKLGAVLLHHPVVIDAEIGRHRRLRGNDHFPRRALRLKGEPLALLLPEFQFDLRISKHQLIGLFVQVNILVLEISLIARGGGLLGQCGNANPQRRN